MFYSIAAFVSILLATAALVSVAYFSIKYVKNNETLKELTDKIWKIRDSENPDDPENAEQEKNLLEFGREINDGNQSLKNRILFAAIAAVLFLVAYSAFDSYYKKSDYYLRQEAEKQLRIDEKVEELKELKQKSIDFEDTINNIQKEEE